jgi:hypothetical protein
MGTFYFIRETHLKLIEISNNLYLL